MVGRPVAAVGVWRGYYTDETGEGLINYGMVARLDRTYKLSSPETTSMGEWAWEFLRRNHAYHQDYKNLVAKFDRIGLYEAIKGNSPLIINGDRKSTDERLEIIEEGELLYDKFVSKYKVARFFSGIPNPALSYKEEIPVFLVGSKLKFYNFFHKSKVTGKISTYIHTGLSEGSIPHFIKHGINKEDCLANKSRVAKDFVVNSRSLVVQISLERPLLEQMKMIKKAATAQQKQLSEWGLFEKSRKESERYVGYLQLLDALESGAEKQRILDTLFPNLTNEDPDYYANKSFYNWKSTAEKLRDSGYIKLASLHHPAGC